MSKRLSKRNLRLCYAAAVLSSFAAVLCWRRDLSVPAWNGLLSALARPGPAPWPLLAQGLLLAAILSATLFALAWSPRPLPDAIAMLLAAAAGWAAEAWGTRLGFWSYYTRERPPLWIIPAWMLGTLLVERAARALARHGRPPALLDSFLRPLCLLAVLVFCAPRLRDAVSWAGPAAAAVCLWLGAGRGEENWRLPAAMFLVFFADAWGAASQCWTYYLGRQPPALAAGIAFAMAFDAALAVGCLRLADAILPFTVFSLEIRDEEPHNNPEASRRTP
ncbi:MAG: hypothetical protein KGO96_03535 [Elusimicrobia bacterium]|nr:hypothetical protein [Elusimicrobiota bacterium]MDE2237412.1 hypothetical protein [Elusimicrobiota bacterium]MDE2424965.1 hypothetical protein [Elusimicrobiota bacterium]